VDGENEWPPMNGRELTLIKVSSLDKLVDFVENDENGVLKPCASIRIVRDQTGGYIYPGSANPSSLAVQRSVNRMEHAAIAFKIAEFVSQGYMVCTLALPTAIASEWKKGLPSRVQKAW